MTTYKYVSLQREGTTLLATLANPPRNLLNAPMVAELTALVAAVEKDTEVRALILTGGAEGIFITHYDVSELSTLSDRIRGSSPDGPGGRNQTGGAPAELHGMHKLLLKLQSLPQPVIAAINGTAMGGGCELALACDFRYMAKTPGAVIGLPEVRVVILPGAGGTQRLTRLLGVARATELMLLGSVVDAETAERIGLVHRAIVPERLLPESLALAEELAKRPPISIALIKQCILKGSEMPLLDGLHFEQDAFWQAMRSEDTGRLMREYTKGERALSDM